MKNFFKGKTKFVFTGSELSGLDDHEMEIFVNTNDELCFEIKTVDDCSIIVFDLETAEVLAEYLNIQISLMTN